MFNFNKSVVIGVSISPDNGIEAAQVDFENKTVLKYISKPLAYDNNRKEIADLDIFKETLQDLLIEMDVPTGSDIALTLPTVAFKVVDYPASLTEDEISNAVEEDLVSHPIFQNNDPCISAVRLPNSTIQFSKIAYTALQKSILIEIAMQIKEMGYNLINIDTSVNSTLNALIYNERINTAPDSDWVLLLVDNNFCRIIPMGGKNYVDSYEEKISIGQILGDAENYSTVANAVNPILKNIPSQCLYVVSESNLISAKILADKLQYNAPIIHQESNSFNETPFLETAEDIPEDVRKNISLDVIGAAINREIDAVAYTYLNLFNESLGDIYTQNQPPVIFIGERKFVLSLNNMIAVSIIFFILVMALTLLIVVPISKANRAKQDEIAKINTEISDIEDFLKKNDSISANKFDEGDEIRMGIASNKNIYTYYTIVGTEIPKKLWLTSLELGKGTIIKGQADNLESIYAFFRNIKDYNPSSNIKLQKLALAANGINKAIDSDDVDKDDIITSLNADYYEFVIADTESIEPADEESENDSDNKNNGKGKDNNKNNGALKGFGIPALEPIN